MDPQHNKRRPQEPPVASKKLAATDVATAEAAAIAATFAVAIPATAIAAAAAAATACYLLLPPGC